MKLQIKSFKTKMSNFFISSHILLSNPVKLEGVRNMAEARARRNQGKFSRLRTMVGFDWRDSHPGDLGIALWNKRAHDCVYFFTVVRVSDSTLSVRFEGDDCITIIVPDKMPVVVTADEDLMEELRRECKGMWPKLFPASESESDSGVDVSGDETGSAGTVLPLALCGGVGNEQDASDTALPVVRTLPTRSAPCGGVGSEQDTPAFLSVCDPMGDLKQGISRFAADVLLEQRVALSAPRTERQEISRSEFVRAGESPGSCSDFST